MSSNHILIIDDDSNYCESLKDTLVESGYDDVDVLHDGSGLLQWVDSTPDLIILDVMMPHLGAYSVIEQINRESRFSNVAIIVITGKKELQDSFGSDENVHACFIKPIHFPDILARINEVFVQKDQQATLAKIKSENQDLQKDIQKIAERKRLRSENATLKAMIKQMDERFYNVVGKSLDGAVVFDREGKIVYVNPEAETMFGASASQLLGQELEIPLDRTRHQLTLSIDGKDAIDVESIVTNIIWEEQPAILASLRDITDSKKYERKIEELNDALETEKKALKHLNEELSSFSHTISHDLQSPLRTIIGFSLMVLKDNEEILGTNSTQHLERVISNGQKISSMINSLLTYSRLSHIEKEDVNIRDVLDNAISLMDSDIKEQNASVVIKGALPIISCSSDQVTQIFLNLIGNGIKYVPEDRAPHIEIGCEEKEDKNLFYVKDNGIGIKENQVPKIFKIFSRLHSEKSPYQGTGIGLTTVKKLVELHDGKIYVESVVGEGTTFYFTLQRESSPETKASLHAMLDTQNEIESAVHNSVEVAPLPILSAPHLLVVDDSEDALELFKATVRSYDLDYSISYVSSGQDAIDYVFGEGVYADREQYPMCTAVLLDINMPVLDGFDVLQTIKKDVRYADIPVVAMFSTSDAPKDKQKATELGALSYIEKKVESDELIKRINEAMAKVDKMTRKKTA